MGVLQTTEIAFLLGTLLETRQVQLQSMRTPWDPKLKNPSQIYKHPTLYIW